MLLPVLINTIERSSNYLFSRASFKILYYWTLLSKQEESLQFYVPNLLKETKKFEYQIFERASFLSIKI